MINARADPASPLSSVRFVQMRLMSERGLLGTRAGGLRFLTLGRESAVDEWLRNPNVLQCNDAA